VPPGGGAGGGSSSTLSDTGTGLALGQGTPADDAFAFPWNVFAGIDSKPSAVGGSSATASAGVTGPGAAGASVAAPFVGSAVASTPFAITSSALASNALLTQLVIATNGGVTTTPFPAGAPTIATAGLAAGAHHTSLAVNTSLGSGISFRLLDGKERPPSLGTAPPGANLRSGPSPTLPGGSAGAVDQFGLDLYNQLDSQAGNLFFSPFSIEAALAMTYAGARGQTADEMASVLHLGPNDAQTHAAFGALLNAITADGNGLGSQLCTADALWGQESYPFLPNFIQLIHDDYGGGLHGVDFIGATEQARNTVNNWVSDQTHGKIQDLIPPDVFDQRTRLALTNAIYFQGDWASPFDANNTHDGGFTLDSGQTAQVPLMHEMSRFLYGHQDGVQTLEMQYQGSHLAMDVLLPDQANGLSALEHQLTAGHLAAWLSGLSQQEVAVTLPKFQLTTASLSLTGTLEQLGMHAAFTPQADFSGIDGGANPLQISNVVHKAFIGVGEKGTEAAAATAVIVMQPTFVGPNDEVMPINFQADHPFVYLIRDTATNTVLFLGRVTDPS
jgi:serpin B